MKIHLINEKNYQKRYEDHQREKIRNEVQYYTPSPVKMNTHGLPILNLKPCLGKD